jgi:TonB-linked SusC/RagA family outer membrane protein
MKIGVLIIIMVLSNLIAQETLDIQGIVKDKNSDKILVGADIVVQGTTLGGSSDINGAYTIKSVPMGELILECHFIGYKSTKQTINTNNVTEINFILEIDVLNAEKVIITALGITRENKAIGYAVQDISGEEFRRTQESNIINTLSGRVAGAQVTGSSGAVGAGSRIILRGNNSLTGNNQPLFVIDGVPMDNTSPSSGSYGGIVDYGNAASDINSHDIESITVLKGANSAAMYGSRAANGVILVTTKSGKSKPGGGVNLTYEMHRTSTNVAVLPDFQNKYGQGSPIEEDSLSALGAFEYLDGNYGGINDGTDESWGPLMDGTLIKQFTNPDTPTPFVAHPDNVKDFFVTGNSLSHHVAMTGGNYMTNFRLSLTNVEETGMFPNTDQSRNTISFTGKSNITDKLSASTSFSYVKTNNDNLVGNGYDGINPLQQMGNWFGRQVDVSALKNYENPDGTPYNWNHSYHDNPYWIMHKNTNSRNRDRFFGNILLSYDLLNWLKLKGRVGTDYYTEDKKQVRAMYSNSYANGYFEANTSTKNETNADLTLLANRDLTSEISLYTVLGANYRDYNGRYQETIVDGLIIPDLYSVSNASGTPTTDITITKLRENSIYGSASLSWSDLVFLDLTGRNDWSSTLPKDNWSYFYPSATTSVIFSELAGISQSTMWGKARFSWAQVGRSASPYSLQGSYNSSDAFGGIGNLSYDNTLSNANLKPEQTTSSELGFDLKFFDNRYGLDLTLYNQRTENQVMEVAISAASGFTAQSMNAGIINNKGIELMLYGTPVRKDDFSWDINLNYASNINEVEELYGDLESIRLWSAWGLELQARPGEAYGTIYGYGYKRAPDGQRIVKNDGGYWNGTYAKDDTLSNLGSIQPKWTGGITNTFRIGPLSISSLIDAKIGGKIFSVTNMFGMYSGVLKETVEGNDDATPVTGNDIRDVGGVLLEGVNMLVSNSDDTTYVTNDIAAPAHVWGWSHYQSLSGHEQNVFDASYIKLRDIVITYDLPQNWTKKLGIAGASISLEGRNLLILYKNAPHIDPETAFSGAFIGGIEQNQTPSSRTFGSSLRIRF